MWASDTPQNHRNPLQKYSLSLSILSYLKKIDVDTVPKPIKGFEKIESILSRKIDM